MSAEQYKIQTSVFSTGSNSRQDAQRRLMASGIIKQDVAEGVQVQKLNITDKGIPMVTFFEIVDAMSDVEDDLNNAVEIVMEE